MNWPNLYEASRPNLLCGLRSRASSMGRPLHGELVYIWLPWTAAAAGGAVGPVIAKKIVDAAIEWAHTRFASKPNKRPKYVAIYGPDGKVIQSVLIKDETAAPEDRTATDAAHPPRQRPPVREEAQ